MWIDPAVSYKFELTDSNDVQIWSIDNTGVDAGSQLAGNLAAPSGSSLVGFLQAGADSIGRTVQDKLREGEVSVNDKTGADPTGVVASTAAAQAALDTAAEIVFPAGTWKVGQLTVPSGVRRIRGHGVGKTIINADGAIAFAGLFNLNGNSGVEICDMTINVPLASYPDGWGISLISCSDCYIHHISMPQSPAAGIRGQDCSDILVERCTVQNWGALGITFTGANERITISKNYVPGSGTQTSHNIQIIGGGGHTIEGNGTTNNVAGSFGANMYQVTGSHIRGNVFSSGVAEGCNYQDSTYSTIIGNVVIASPSSGDFGISIFGDPVLGGTCTGIVVANNTIYNAGKSGIAFAARINNCLAIGNHIHNCNQLNEAMGAGVLFYGLGCNSNSAIGNFTYDTSAKVKYSTNEWDDGSGVPVGNIYANNPVSANGLTAEWNTIATSSRVSALKWKSYTPTIASTAGTITSYTINSAEYKPSGDQMHIRIHATITNNGTGSGALQITLPSGFSAATNGGIVVGREIITAGHMIAGIPSGSAMNILNYNNAYPVATNSQIVIEGSYKLV